MGNPQGRPLSEITACRFCGSASLVDVWSFGKTPLANSYLCAEHLEQPELRAPLVVCRCLDCNLVQLRHTVSPEILFPDYLYVSSTSPSFIKHFDAYAERLVERFGLSSGDLAVDIGSNDGILLKPLAARGVRVQGVEPAARIAQLARDNGIETISDFFTAQVAEQIAASAGQARVITANNVFAHIADLEEVVSGIKRLLTSDGVFVFEAQYLKDLLEKNLFDIVYHEHLFYYHVAPLKRFFAERGMGLFDVERLPVHGGSIRVFVQLAGGPHVAGAELGALIAAESAAGLNSNRPYEEFFQRVEHNKQETRRMLAELKAAGKRIVGYGAPAKATTLLHFYGIGKETLDYIVDDDKKFKQGRFMPGSHIPIVPPERLAEDRPDYCLILAWNFAEPIVKNNAEFTNNGGRFMIPAPIPRIIET